MYAPKKWSRSIVGTSMFTRGSQVEVIRRLSGVILRVI